MTVREVLTMASQFLNKEEEFSAFIKNDNGDSVGTKSFKVLFSALNIVNNEIASDYFPLFYKQEIDVTHNKIFNIDLNQELKDVYKISSLDNSVSYRFKTFDNYIEVGANGKMNITYSYLPQKISMTDDLPNYSGKISVRTFALGVAAEYCFISNIFDEAEVWHRRFVDSIKNNLSKKSHITLPKRKWLWFMKRKLQHHLINTKA